MAAAPTTSPARHPRPPGHRSTRDRRENPESEWYGFARVAPAVKTEKVERVFGSVASRYDIMNDLMSLGLHRLWKDRFVAALRPKPGQNLLDVAAGTGDIALRCARRSQGQAHITVCDINPAMLAQGRAKAIDQGWLDEITWVVGNAEALPIPDRSQDTVCIAFGLRNVTRIDTALREFARILKPGGRFFCLEFSPEIAPWLQGLYDLYSFTVLPWLGEQVAEDREAYQYLAESIRQFPPPAKLAQRMEKAGLALAKWDNLSFGIAALHTGWKL